MSNTQIKGNTGLNNEKRKEWLKKKIKETEKGLENSKYTKYHRQRLEEYNKELAKLNEQGTLGRWK